MFISSVQCTLHNSFSHYQHCSDLGPLKVKRDRMLSNYTMSELFLDDFVCSYLRLSARLVQCLGSVHAPFDSVKQYQLIPHNSLSHYQPCSDLWPLKSSEIKARSYIIKLRNCLNKNITSAPLIVHASLPYSCSNHYQ